MILTTVAAVAADAVVFLLALRRVGCTGEGRLARSRYWIRNVIAAAGFVGH